MDESRSEKWSGLRPDLRRFTDALCGFLLSVPTMPRLSISMWGMPVCNISRDYPGVLDKSSFEVISLVGWDLYIMICFSDGSMHDA